MDSHERNYSGVIYLESKSSKTKYYYVGLAIVCAILIIISINQFSQTHIPKNMEAGALVQTSNVSTDQANPTAMPAYASSLKKWNNVEITFYAKRVSEQSQVSSQGITTGACSGSHDDDVTYHSVCKDSKAYQNTVHDERLTYDGSADYVNEALYYKGGALSDNSTGPSPKMISAFSNFTSPIDPSTGSHIMHKNTWVDYKFVVRSTYNDTTDVQPDQPLVLHYNMVVAGLR